MDYQLEIEIEKPRETIAELFGNPDNLAYWQPGFLGITPIDGEAGRNRLDYRHGNRQVSLIETVSVDNLPDEYSATYESPGMRIEVKNRFEAIGPERTRWISENHGEVSGFMMRLITLIMPGCFRNQSFAYMENFKAFAETGADIRES